MKNNITLDKFLSFWIVLYSLGYVLKIFPYNPIILLTLAILVFVIKVFIVLYYYNKKYNLMNNTRDIAKVRLHDGIVGLLNIGSIVLASELGFNWIYIAVAVAVLQILSPITKFCPVYTILNKLMPDTTPIQNGK